MGNIGGTSELTPQGDVTVNTIRALAGEWEEAVGGGGGVRVNLSGVTQIDMAGIQLLWAARRAVLESGRAFTVAPSMPEGVRERFEQAGLRAFLESM